MTRFTPVRLPPRRGRVVALFGPPGAGVTTIVRVLVDASKLMLRRQAWPDDAAELGPDDLVWVVGAMQEGACGMPVPDACLLDSLQTADELQALWQDGALDGGCVVQVHADVALLPDERAAYDQRRADIEHVVRLYHIPYYTINNVRDDLEAPVAELARRAQVRT